MHRQNKSAIGKQNKHTSADLSQSGGEKQTLVRTLFGRWINVHHATIRGVRNTLNGWSLLTLEHTVELIDQDSRKRLDTDLEEGK